MQKYETFSNSKKTINYTKLKFLLQIKALKEYKTNLWAAIFSSIVFTSIAFTATFAMKKAFTNVIPWSNEQYIFFILIHGTTALLSAPFWFGFDLKTVLTKGIMNNYLSRPINPIIQYFISTTYIYLGFGLIVNLSLLTYFLIFILDSINYWNLLKLVLFTPLAATMFVITGRTFDSVAFFFKEHKKLFSPYNRTANILDQYPSPIFSKSQFYFLVFLFPNAYSGGFATNIFFGYTSNYEYWVLIGILILIISTCSMIIYLLWKFGLQKYEAYN